MASGSGFLQDAGDSGDVGPKAKEWRRFARLAFLLGLETSRKNFREESWDGIAWSYYVRVRGPVCLVNSNHFMNFLFCCLTDELCEIPLFTILFRYLRSCRHAQTFAPIPHRGLLVESGMVVREKCVI